MKNQIRSRTVASGDAVSRRRFLGQTAAAAIGFSIVPRRVLGGPDYVPPSDKVNIAFIGVGAQGLRVMLHFLREPDVQGVAVCDCNKTGANYPQWDTHEFCNSVRKLLGVDSGWDWLSNLARKLWTATMPVSSDRAVITAVPLTPTSANCLRSRRISMPWLSAPPTTCTQPYPPRP